MSLRVWLPLTKDLKNQGLDDITVTNNGATFDANGKLGGCYSFDGSHYLQSNKQIGKGWKEITFACWVYLNEAVLTSGSWYRILGIGAHTRAHLDIASNNTLRLFVSQTGTTSGLGVYSTTVGQAGKWYHLCGVLGNNYMSIYINGLKENEIVIDSSSITYTNADYFRVGSITSGNAFNGKINDVRVYDHALSPLEVKQISQGLILHYPLNRNGWGNENLLKYTQVNALNKNLLKTNISTGWDKLTLTTKDGYDCYLYPMSQSPTWFCSSTWYKLKANTVYTYSAYIYFTKNANFSFTSLGHFQVYNAASTASDKAHEDIVSARIYEPSTIQANKWTKIRITFTTNNLANSEFVIYPRYAISTNVGDLYIRKFKLEEGDKATPWCPNSTDELYNTLGLNNNIQYDISGYKNNGTKINTLTYSSDTPKYNISTHFGATNQKIHIENLTTTGFSNSYSFAWWGKRTSNTPMFWGFSNGVRLNGMYLGNLWNTGDGSNNPIYKPGTTTQITVPSLNTWHHYVMTGDGATCKLYLDGELYGQAKTYKPITGTSIFINGWDSGTSYCHDNMDMSDFRIYTTVLSAEDVKSLYQNSAYIDNQGNIYGAVYEEV